MSNAEKNTTVADLVSIHNHLLRLMNVFQSRTEEDESDEAFKDYFNNQIDLINERIVSAVVNAVNTGNTDAGSIVV